MKSIVKSSLVILLCLMFSSLVISDEKKVLTYDEMIKIERISEPALSPDGKMVAFTSAKYSFETDSKNEDIWLVSTEGKELKRMTRYKSSDMSPAWSPDGSKLAFISTRSDTPQVFLLDMNSMGDPVKLTDIPTGISTFKWAPGGEYILFTSEVFKGCEDFECNKKRLKNEETKKVTAIVSDILLYRHWNFWKAGKVSHLFSMRLDDKKIVDLTPGDSWVPFGPFQGAEQYTVSPDGKTVAFSKRTGDQPACDTNDDIYTVSIDGGDIEQITKAKGSDTTPRYSPDGKYLSYIKMARGGFESDRQVLMLINLATKKDFALTSSYDGDVSEYVWTPDSRRVYFTSISRGRIGLYNVGLQDRKVERLYQNGICGSPAISRDGKFLTYTWQNSMRPREIYRFNLVNNNPVRLTRMNEDVMSAIEMNPIEDIDFRGAGGDMVHGFILKPPFFDKTKKYPLIYIIHGGPQGATRDGFHYRWNLQMFASRGYVVASVNFHGSSGYGQKFEDSITYDWGGKPYRDLMIGLDHIVSKYRFVDRKRIGAAGASYGGYMISWIAGHTERFKCLVAHAGVYNLSSMYGATEELWFPEWEYHGTPWTNPSHYRKMSPSTYVKRFKTPTMVIHGQNDFRVPVTQGMEFFTALQKMGVESKFIYFPDESHFVQKPNNARFWYKQVLDWMDKYLKK